MDTSSPSDSNESYFKRILNRIGLFRPPDSAEDIEQEIQEILEEGEEQGLITRDEGRLITSILEFKDTLAHEIMTPRSEMVSAVDSADVAEIIHLIVDRGYTRIPIYKDSPDQIIGILHAKDLLPYCLKSDRMPAAADLVKPAFFVMETRKIVDLLKDFQNQKIHMAIVTDEFGGVRGLVTLEDVVEEIVGEIRDEYDKTERRWKVVNPETLLVDARVDIEEVEEFFGVDMPEGPYESVGGLIIYQLDRVPEPGSTLLINTLVFEVVSANNRKINTVKVQKKSV